jgi:NRAMP (natural resistance-associated macrophage protein)-like metal ion transporter
MPAFMGSVAYIDPGDFATNIQGGAKFGYMLPWVIVLSNLMAMRIQTASAKQGIATGKFLAEDCRERLCPCFAGTSYAINFASKNAAAAARPPTTTVCHALRIGLFTVKQPLT